MTCRNRCSQVFPFPRGVLPAEAPVFGAGAAAAGVGEHGAAGADETPAGAAGTFKPASPSEASAAVVVGADPEGAVAVVGKVAAVSPWCSVPGFSFSPSGHFVAVQSDFNTSADAAAVAVSAGASLDSAAATVSLSFPPPAAEPLGPAPSTTGTPSTTAVAFSRRGGGDAADARCRKSPPTSARPIPPSSCPSKAPTSAKAGVPCEGSSETVRVEEDTAVPDELDAGTDAATAGADPTPNGWFPSDRTSTSTAPIETFRGLVMSSQGPLPCPASPATAIVDSAASASATVGPAPSHAETPVSATRVVIPAEGHLFPGFSGFESAARRGDASFIAAAPASSPPVTHPDGSVAFEEESGFPAGASGEQTVWLSTVGTAGTGIVAAGGGATGLTFAPEAAGVVAPSPASRLFPSTAARAPLLGPAAAVPALPEVMLTAGSMSPFPAAAAAAAGAAAGDGDGDGDGKEEALKAAEKARQAE